MTSAAFVLLSLAAVAAVLDWLAVAADKRAMEYALKPIVMVVLILATFSLEPSSNLARGLLAVGLALSLIGDVCLMLPSDAFLAGLAAFFTAHVLYIAALLDLGVDMSGIAMGILVMAVVAIVVARPIVLGARAAAPALTGPVAAYIAVLSVMVVVAMGTGRAMAIIGGVLFAASDSVLGWTRFVADFPRSRVVVMVTYHLAQFGLVLALL